MSTDYFYEVSAQTSIRSLYKVASFLDLDLDEPPSAAMHGHLGADWKRMIWSFLPGHMYYRHLPHSERFRLNLFLIGNGVDPVLVYQMYFNGNYSLRHQIDVKWLLSLARRAVFDVDIGAINILRDYNLKYYDLVAGHYKKFPFGGDFF